MSTRRWYSIAAVALIAGSNAPLASAASSAPARYPAKVNVRNAIPAAEIWYLDTQSYRGLSHAVLERESPGISPNVRAFAMNHGRGYCIDDREPGGDSAYYVGGVPGRTRLQVHIVATGRCK